MPRFKEVLVFKGEEYLILAKAAERMKAHPQTVLRWVRKGKGLDGIPVKAIQDPFSRMYYIDLASVVRSENPDTKFVEV